MRKKIGTLAILLAAPALSAGAAASGVQDIVRRSVANTNADWESAPLYSFTEHDVITRGGSRGVKTYQVLMIDGSPYNRLLSEEGHALTAAGSAGEQRKLELEIARRRGQSRAARARRIARYQAERRQDRALMAEIAKAFDYNLLGRETVNGRECFVLSAAPRPGYQPPTRDTRVLKGMRGKMWIDVHQFQWVKVHAEVFRPVAFGLFIAQVEPGTSFTLEQQPVAGSLWLPSHFSVSVKSRILLFAHNSFDDETYSNYRRAARP